MAFTLGDKSSAVSRKKALIAALLAAILLGILFYPSAPAERDSDAANKIQATGHTSDDARRPNMGDSFTETASVQRTTDLPPVEIARLLSLNPFQLIGHGVDQTAPSTTSSSVDDEDAASGDSDRPSIGIGRRATISGTEMPRASARPEITVSGIITGGNRPAALIGDRLVYESDEIEPGWKIVSIRSRSVVVEPTHHGQQQSIDDARK